MVNSFVRYIFSSTRNSAVTKVAFQSHTPQHKRLLRNHHLEIPGFTTELLDFAGVGLSDCIAGTTRQCCLRHADHPAQYVLVRVFDNMTTP